MARLLDDSRHVDNQAIKKCTNLIYGVTDLNYRKTYYGAYNND